MGNKIFFLEQFYVYNELNFLVVSNGCTSIKIKYDNRCFFFVKNMCIICYCYFFFGYLNLSFQFLCFNVFQGMFYQFGHLKLEGRGNKFYDFFNFVVGKLGYSHICYYLLPFNILFFSKKKRTDFKIVSHNSFTVGNSLKCLRSFRFPNNYKKKGIFVSL
jgi:hypothetical protein